VDGVTTSSVLNLAMSSLSLIISLGILIVHLKNRNIQFNAYAINRHTHRSSSIDLVFVSGEQLDDSVLLKLVLFNPDSVAAIIKSFTLYKEVKSTSFFGRLFGSTEWKEITLARWWPTVDSSSKTPRSFADEYQNLYVEDCRDILVSMPGMIDRNHYRFVIETNLGGYQTISTIDATRSYFPYAFRQWFYER
jgi:hypothetical protein